jgi:hypothetical protein
VRRFPRILVAVVATIAAGVPQASADVPVRLVADGVWRTGTVAVPDGATVAGVRVRGAAPASIALRATDGYVTLDQVGGGFTEPVWIGRTRRVQIRVRGASGPVAVVFVKPGAGPPAAPAARRAADDPAQPPIISRAGWGADESIKRGSPNYFDRLGVVFVHHTASASNYGAADVPALIRGFYRFHVLSRGWFDIGYNYLVDRYGRIYEGRSGGITRNVRGAQVSGFNTGSAGVALIGTYSSTAPTDVQMTALRDVIGWRLDIAHVDPLGTAPLVSAGGDRYRAGTVVPVRAISGHRDVGSTSCPGANVYARLPALREEIAALPLLRIYGPVVAPADIDPATGPLPIRFTARLSAAAPWRVAVADAGGSPVAEWTGTGTAVDATWAEPAPTSLAGLHWRIEAAGARPAEGIFDDLASAPSGDVLRGAHVATTATGAVTVAYSLTASARISTAITDPAGKLVKVLDAGTRRARGAQQVVWTGPSGHYRAVLRMARSAGVAVTTLPFDIRRGVGSVTLRPAVVNARGPSRLALRATRLERVPVRIRLATSTRTILAGPPGRIGANFATARLPEGRLQLRISAETAGGTQIVTRTVLVDRTAPRATRLSHRKGVLRGTLSEPATVTVGNVRRTFGKGRFAMRVRTLHTLVVRDVAGNVRHVAHP